MHPAEPSCSMRTDGHTGWQTDTTNLIGELSNFANTSKKLLHLKGLKLNVNGNFPLLTYSVRCITRIHIWNIGLLLYKMLILYIKWRRTVTIILEFRTTVMLSLLMTRNLIRRCGSLQWRDTKLNLIKVRHLVWNLLRKHDGFISLSASTSWAWQTLFVESP